VCRKHGPEAQNRRSWSAERRSALPYWARTPRGQVAQVCVSLSVRRGLEDEAPIGAPLPHCDEGNKKTGAPRAGIKIGGAKRWLFETLATRMQRTHLTLPLAGRVASAASRVGVEVVGTIICNSVDPHPRPLPARGRGEENTGAKTGEAELWLIKKNWSRISMIGNSLRAANSLHPPLEGEGRRTSSESEKRDGVG
jgi:hypothetical protein